VLFRSKEKALDQLGVHEEDAEFELLDEPKQGLFGRVRGEARVRARVRPTQARQKVDRRDRRSRGERPARDGQKDGQKDGQNKDGQRDGQSRNGQGRGGQGRNEKDRAVREKTPRPPVEGATATAAKAQRQQAPRQENPTPSKNGQTKEQQQVDPRQVGEEAQRFLEALVGAFGLEGTAELVEDGDDLEVRVHGQELGLLVGPRGTTLQAVQDLARVASQRRLGDHDTRLRVDVGGYRERRRVALGKFAVQMADEVKASGVARVLEPMSSADRKIIHDTLATVEGIATRSEGDDPYRRVVIAPGE
jgi:spoIIIJ-associated protein